MKWIKASERLPEEGKRVICRWYKHGEFLRIDVSDAHQLRYWIEHEPEEFEWLDESEPSFSLEDMKTAFEAAFEAALCIGDCFKEKYHSDEMNKYFKDNYNIAL